MHLVALRRQLLECLLLLLSRGCVFPVLTILERWLEGADLSLVRHLINQLLTLAAPPFAARVARTWLDPSWHPPEPSLTLAVDYSQVL